MLISNCCNTKVAYIDEENGTGICSDCHEHCVIEESGENTTILSPQETINRLGTKEEFEEANPFLDEEHNKLLDDKLKAEAMEELGLDEDEQERMLEDIK